VYGATPGGIAAAVTLAERGHQVALLEPQATIGGMMAGGLGRTDFGSIHALGGLFKQYLAEVSVHYTETYGADSPQAKVMRGGLYFESHVARMILERWVAASPNLQLLRQAHLVGVKCVNGRVAAVVIQDRERAVRRTLAARLFVDASYEGDLAAMAGAPYLIGRESREQYGEPHAGELWWNVWERRVVEVVGTGDRKVQAYNYRLCLTRQVDNRLPPPPPRVYDRGRYASLLPDIAAGRLKRLKDIIDILELPGSKADANNHPQGNPSSDLIGGADDYPEANYRQRQAIALEHRDHILGLLWFLRFDPEVPEALRLDAQQWGLARDEFPETESWPSQLYVREGRRLLGEVVFSQRDAMAAPGSERSPIRADSVAVGAYPMDSHATGGRHPQHPELLEGFFYLARGETKPYQIPYAIMLPRGLHNVAMVCCVSSTHIGYGTLRMEPVFMALGLAAAVAGDHALHGGRQLDDLSVARLQWDLLRQGQVLTVFEDVEVGSRGWAALNYLGTRGCFATYLAQPDEALTGTELQGWLAALPW
ncbi:MAG: FAD-dependent oxidoreductase, partial [Armatimonadetes bacterium]|nr:FAD-dependent oxidoreductase [Armatimonadota bacterium]